MFVGGGGLLFSRARNKGAPRPAGAPPREGMAKERAGEEKEEREK